MKVLIITGGNIDDDFASSFLKKNYYDEIIAVDGGLAFADRSDLSITHLVGDFDTIDGTILEKYIHRSDICVHQFIPEKDYTDTDIAVKLALSLIKKHHSEENEEMVIHILGGTGSRLDHVLANLQMLKNILDEDVRGIIIDQNNIIEMIRGERVLKREEMTGTYVSLIPVTMELTGITLSGFKYPLENASSHFGESLMVSNELLEEEGRIFIKEGMAWMIISND